MSGEAGTAQTVKLMRRLIDQAVSDQTFVRHAIDIVRNVPAYNDLAEASAVYEYVTRSIRYTKDPVTKEKLYPPAELLKIRAGDCDDIAMLMGALGIALGFPARLITISSNSTAPEEFTHVYTELEVPPGSGEWVPMDAARPGAQFGIEPPAYFRKRAWSLTDDTYADLSGCDCGGTCKHCQVGTGALCGLAGYTVVPHLGQGDGIDWGGILSQTIQEVPSIVAVASGQPTAVRTQYGSTQTGAGPYGSFATPYTPGYGVPYAGYSAPSTASLWLSQNWPIVGIGFLALLAFSGRK